MGIASPITTYPAPSYLLQGQTMATILDFQCLHCDAPVSATEMKDGWCESCGKKLPYSVQCEARKTVTVPTQLKDDYDEPRPGSGRRLLVGGLVFVSLMVTAALVVLKMG